MRNAAGVKAVSMAKKRPKSKVKKAPQKTDVRSANGTGNVPNEAGQISLIEFDRWQALFLAVLILVGIIIYANTLEVPYVLDDQIAIEHNPLIRMAEITPKSIIDAAFGFGKSRPVPMLSFGINYFFGQDDVRGYHLVNMIIHIVNGILLFFLVKLSLTLSNRQPDGLRKLEPISIAILSFFTALLWLASPVQIQSVTYIVQRMTSMGAMFYLLALILYARGRISQRTAKQVDKSGLKHYYFWFAGCLVAGLLALGSKESTAMLPIFIFLYEWYFFQELDESWFKRQIKYIVAIALLFALVAGIYLGFDPLGKFNTLRDYVLQEFTIGQRLMTQTRVVIFYLSLIFFPNPSRLNLDHDFPLSYSLFNPVTTFASLVLIIALLGLAIYLAKKQRLISFCILWFFGNLVIESSVIPLALIFEHRIYLPSMFVFLAVVVLFHRYIRPVWLTAAIACAAVAVSAWWTHERNKIWQDDLVLWTDCHQKSPNKARPYLNIGQILTERHKFDEALPNFLKAIEINPNFVDAHYNIAVLYNKRKEPDKAIDHYRKALDLEPDNADANNNLGVALFKKDMTEEAIVYYRRALAKDPNMAAAHINLGLALSKQDKPGDAIVHYRKALLVSSHLPKAQFHLGAALVKQGRPAQGMHHIKRSLEIDPEFAEAHNNLGGHLLQEGKIDEALYHFNAALKIEPEIAEAHNNVGIIMIHKEKISEGLFHFQEAVRLNPEFELARDNLQRAIAIQQANLDAELRRIQSELKTRPDDPVLACIMGNLYLARGDLNSAIGWFEKATTLQPDFPQALNNLSMAYTFTGQHDRALEELKKLIALQPDNAANYYNVAVLYALQNNEAEALAWLNQAVEKGYNKWELIKTDRDLENIRDTEGYKELVEGH